jgi:16S rRNA (cytidine1402-2'-O)-methyltransferase
MTGKLTLVVTPIEELGELKEQTTLMLKKASEDLSRHIIAVEDAKPARRRWLHWGLPRETIENFVYYNEHEQKSLTSQFIKELKAGKDIYLMSDGGVPAFCDPGCSLVRACHEQGICVEVSSCDNSLISAVAVSGFTEGPFHFLGFPPKEKSERLEFFKKVNQLKEVCVFMDTPYRLERCLDEMKASLSDKKICLAMDLGRDSGAIAWGKPAVLRKTPWGKREFVCVIEGQTLG